jgi:O-antigen/teichoic acid export membrane protein
LIQTIYINIYPLIIGKRYLASDVGLYTRADQFPNTASTALTSAMNQVAFPIMSQIQDDDNRLIAVYQKYIQVYCFLTFPVLMGLCGCARPLVSFLLTDKWLDCVPLMQIICFRFILLGIAQLNLNLFYVKGRSDLVLRMELIKKALMFGVLFISMFFGLKAICYGLIINALIDFLLGAFYTQRVLDYKPVQQVKAILPYLILSMVVLAESLHITSLIQNNLLAIATALVVCPVSYWVVAKICKLYAYRESADLIRAKLGMTTSQNNTEQ